MESWPVKRARIASPAVEKGITYYQCFVLLSEKGKHYSEGGAYIGTKQGRLHYEADCKVGDLIVYDGRTVHGVADIDPLEPLDLTQFGGRVAAFASLFRHLEPNGEGYAELSRRAVD